MAVALVSWVASARAQARLDWDYRGRVAAVSRAEHTAGYFYGDTVERALEEHDGSVTYYIAGNFEVRDGIGIVYIKAGDQRVARSSRSVLQAGLLDDLVPDARIDVGDAWLAGSTGREPTRHLYGSARRLLLQGGPATVFLHVNQVGSALLATGTTGQPLGERAFVATGELDESHGHVDSYGFTGQRSDLSSKLVHFAFRELDPTVGAWMSPDPKFLVDGSACLARPYECANGYQFVLNNPVDLIDPTGEMEEWADLPPKIQRAYARESVEEKASDPGDPITARNGNEDPAAIAYDAEYANYDWHERETTNPVFEGGTKKSWRSRARSIGGKALWAIPRFFIALGTNHDPGSFAEFVEGVRNDFKYLRDDLRDLRSYLRRKASRHADVRQRHDSQPARAN
ncbi:MAG: RHS repeat-associated core domain-containing protein [Myxococcales bacterium]